MKSKYIYMRAVEEAALKESSRKLVEEFKKQRLIRRWRTYENYLLSKEWQIKRKQKLKQVGNHCQSCGSKNDLQIHHKTYKRIYDEKFKDLIVLCSGCHKKSHKLSIEDKMIDQHLKAILKEV